MLQAHGARLRLIPPTTTVPLENLNIRIQDERRNLGAGDSAVSRRPIELPTQSFHRPGRKERPAIAVYCRAILPDIRSSNGS